MIITLTANTTLDLTVFIREYLPGRTHRASQTVTSMGGKPTDASWILGETGVPSRALGFAAGINGKRVEAMLASRGATPDFIEVAGDTRINVVIVTADGFPQTTITTTTMRVEPPHLDALRQRFSEALSEASCVVLGGTLPHGLDPIFYTEFIGMARARGIPTIFDAAEPNLSAGLAAQPTYIKPNQDELAGLAGMSITSLADAYQAGHQIIQQYGTSPIITLGADGALAVLPDRAWFVPPLAIQVVSAAGAGDGMLAGLAASVERGQPIEEGIRLGAACAAAVCLMPGTADCRRADVERLLPQVQLLPYSG